MQSDCPDFTEEQLHFQQMHMKQKDDEFDRLFTREHHHINF